MLLLIAFQDKQWKILSETSIKAKSIRGYKTRNFKLTSNKFKLNEPKPELLEDWDPRYFIKPDYKNLLILLF